MQMGNTVFLYSYQQTQFFRQMDWKNMVREVRRHHEMLSRMIGE